VIRDPVERLRPDLLSLGATSRAGAFLGLLGTTTVDLLVDVRCDILVARVMW
jgi:hypothetical protein